MRWTTLRLFRASGQGKSTATLRWRPIGHSSSGHTGRCRLPVACRAIRWRYGRPELPLPYRSADRSPHLAPTDPQGFGMLLTRVNRRILFILRAWLGVSR